MFGRIYRKHSGSISYTYYLTAAKFHVYIGCKCIHRIHICNMRLFIKYSLIKMCHRPAQRYIEIKKLCKLIRRLLSVRISPCLEKTELIAVFIQGYVAMHHGTYTHRSKFYKFTAVLFFNRKPERIITGLKSLMYLFQTVGPHSVYKGIFPIMETYCKHFALKINKYRLNSGRAKLYTERNLTAFYQAFLIHLLLLYSMLIMALPLFLNSGFVNTSSISSSFTTFVIILLTSTLPETKVSIALEKV